MRFISGTLLVLTLLLAALPLQAESLDSHVVSDGVADHFLVRQGGHSAHVLRFKQGVPRILFAFPGGNAGALVEFEAGEASVSALRVVSLGPPTAGLGSRVTVEVTMAGTQATVGAVVQGSLRELRRYLHAGNLAYEQHVVDEFEVAAGKLSPEERAELEGAGLFVTQPRESLATTWRAGTVGDRRQVSSLRPEYLGDREHRLSFLLPSQCKAMGGRQLRLSCPGAESLLFEVEVTVPYHPLVPIPEADVLHPAAREFLDSRAAASASPEVISLLDRAVKSLRFLAYRDKLLAGSFRYLTYFGRDSLLAARMLLPVAGEAVLEATLASVCERLSKDGQVAHEEDLGNEAILRHMERFTALMDKGRRKEALAALKGYDEPVMDYKMVDDNFLLAPFVRDLLTTDAAHLDGPARLRLLRGADGRRLECVAANLEFVLNAAANESLSPYGIALGAGEEVGNWRDSAEGLGGGRYPGDVNGYLVTSALVALGEIAGHDLLRSAGLEGLLEAGGFPSLYRALQDPDWLDSLLRRFETIAKGYQVVTPLPHLRSAVRQFLEGLPPASRAWFDGLEVEEGCPLATFARGHCYPADLAEGLPLLALALDKAGKPLPVLHSDGVFALFDGPMAVDQLEAVLKGIVYPYPLGLWTDVGPVVANGVVTGDPERAKQFGPDRYHGAVVWGWVLGMLELGLMKQQSYLDELAGGCGQACDELQRLGTRLAAVRRQIPALAASELWSWAVQGGRLVPVDFGSDAGHATQANPAQLWSTVWLSVYYQLEK